MLGNVMEWAQDAYLWNYAGVPTDGSAQEGSADADRVKRGGHYASGAAVDIRASARNYGPPATGDVFSGTRCCKSAQ